MVVRVARRGWALSHSRSSTESEHLLGVGAAAGKISQRVLTSVKRARQPLYRESAKLLEQYQRLQNRNLPPGEASDILRNVYIRPNTDNGGRLFELYWLFTLLDQYPDPELQLIQAGTNLVAEWTSDRQQYRLYHHSTGPPELDFTINSEEVAEELELLAQGSEQLGYFRRAHTVQRKTREISQQVLGREHREKRSIPASLIFS